VDEERASITVFTECSGVQDDVVMMHLLTPTDIIVTGSFHDLNLTQSRSRVLVSSNNTITWLIPLMFITFAIVVIIVVITC